MVVVMAVTLAPEAPAFAASARPARPDKLPAVAGTILTADKAPVDRTPVLKSAPAVTWPAAGAADVAVAGGPSATQAGFGFPTGLVAGVRPTRNSADKAAGGRVRLEVLDRTAAQRSGRPVVVRVGRSDAVRADLPAEVGIRYAGFRDAFGADWFRRLSLVSLPECALSTPEAVECQAKPLATSNDVAAGVLSAELTVSGSGTSLVALASGPSSDGGTFQATELKPSATWTAGGSSGGFTWSYPLRMPPSTGPAPPVTLAYSSQDVDGFTAATNSQPSWVGEGFTWQPGAIERSYRPCADDGHADKGDNCWAGHNATLTLNGKASVLVPVDGSANVWRPQNEDGALIERLTDASLGNGDADGEYWKVTTLDGVQYFFGRNRLPGFRSGTDPETKSVFYAPVFGNNSQEPCNGASFGVSSCQQGYRWNLDHVIDPNGNTMSLFYERETNRYARNRTNSDTPTYVRGGYLKEIDYGTRLENGADTVFAGTAPARVVFDTSDRCVTPGPTCTLTVANANNWPDVPVDLVCSAATCPGLYSPTFFTTRRLSAVTTQVASGAKAWRRVEQWRLSQEFKDPGDGNQRILWLREIAHCGLTDAECLSPVTFQATQLSNRVDRAGQVSSIIRYRMRSILNETGGVTTISYSAVECVAGSNMPAAADTNTKRCFPQYWMPQGATTPRMEYFHKYVVTEVSEADLTGHARDSQTRYFYDTAPAWHFGEDPMATTSRRTWGDWRGYEKVRVVKGSDDETRSRIDYLYFRGMHGDRTASGTRTVSVTDSDGGTWTDSNWLSGDVREEVTYLGTGTTVVEKSKRDPYVFGPTATQSINGITREARVVANAVTTDTTVLDHSPGTRVTRLSNTYVADRTGRVSVVDDEADVATAADDRCTRHTYASNAAGTMLSYVARSETVAVRCSASAGADDVIAETRTWYDGAAAFGTTVSRGNVSRTEQLTGINGATRDYLTDGRVVHDKYGRMTETFDELDQRSHAAYATNAGGAVVRTETRNPKDWATTAEFDPAWGVPVKVTDVNGQVTEASYDGFGRLTGVWLPGRVKGTDVPDIAYQYLVRRDAPTAVRTSKLNPAGTGHISTYTIYDGFMRERQSQGPAIGGGRMIAETLYDSRGLPYKVRAPYFNPASPSDTLFQPTGDTAVPAQTVTTFDGAERPVVDSYQLEAVEEWRTTVAYGGDHVDATEPPGGTATSTRINSRGGTAALWRYRTNTVGGAHDDTTYEYTKAGHLSKVTDARGNIWQRSYDRLGRTISATDPDLGTSTFEYDRAGRKSKETDPRGNVLAHAYDELDRRTGTFVGSTTGRQLARWTFDTLARGQLTAATRYDDTGNAYVKEVTGYNVRNQATATKVTIPPAAGTALAGVYLTETTYSPGWVPSTQRLARRSGIVNFGGLTEETLTTTYTPTGLESTMSGLTSYVSGIDFLQNGKLFWLQLTDGGGKNVEQYFGYEEGTERLAEHQVLGDFGTNIVARDAFYTYNADGNVTSIADRTAQYGVGPDDVQCFRYEGQERLAEAWTPGTNPCGTNPTAGALGGAAPYWSSYSYDASGNRTQEVRRTASTTSTRAFAHAASGSSAVRPHAVQSVTTTGAGAGVTTYAYDAAGNTVSRAVAGRSTQTLGWDVENHLASVSDGTGTSTYVYDADGQRLIARDSSGTTLYLGDTEFKAAPNGTVAGTRYYSHGKAGTVAVRTPGGLSWLVLDHQGTAQISLRATDLAKGQRRTDPFGGVRSSTGTFGGSRGFVGGTDDATGLVHLGARDFDPVSGRFVTVDPVIELSTPETLNPYLYAGNNPVTESDPSGLSWLKKLGKILEGANNGATWAGIGMMVLGVAIGAAGGGLAVTGFGAVATPFAAALAADLVVAGAGLAVAGIAVGAVNAGMEMRREGGGGGGGSKSDPPASKPHPHEDLAASMRRQHDGGGPKGQGEPLSNVNSYKTTEGGPPGSKPVEVYKDKGADGINQKMTNDINFVDGAGNVVLRREVKVSSGRNSFMGQLEYGGQQVKFDGEVFMQVPKGTNAATAREWLRGFQNLPAKPGRPPLSSYKNVKVRVVTSDGVDLGTYNVTQPPPMPKPKTGGMKFI
jgi:RHS repeat-associated protein